MGGTIKPRDKYFIYKAGFTTESSCPYEHVPNIRTPSQTIQSAIIAYLGQKPPHEESLESQIIFNSTHAYRQISHRRLGAPRTHWAELTMAETYLRLQHQHTYFRPPSTYEVDHPFYKFLQRSDIHAAHSAQLNVTPIFRTLSPIAQDRSQWKRLDFPFIVSFQALKGLLRGSSELNLPFALESERERVYWLGFRV